MDIDVASYVAADMPDDVALFFTAPGPWPTCYLLLDR